MNRLVKPFVQSCDADAPLTTQNTRAYLDICEWQKESRNNTRFRDTLVLSPARTRCSVVSEGVNPKVVEKQKAH